MSLQVSVSVTDPYPVIFYIHGGDLEHGASNQFPGHMLAAWGEVVVVTFNYRLGALGKLHVGLNQTLRYLRVTFHFAALTNTSQLLYAV